MSIFGAMVKNSNEYVEPGVTNSEDEVIDDLVQSGATTLNDGTALSSDDPDVLLLSTDHQDREEKVARCVDLSGQSTWMPHSILSQYRCE